MSDQAEAPAKKQIMATLFLERLAPIDYKFLAEQVGKTLGVNPATVGQDPNQPMVLPVDGDVAFGLKMDFPYPAPLQGPAQFAYWWPNALSDIARNKAHLMVSCAWKTKSRLDAHMCHLVLVRALMEQLPVIGVLWGSSLVQTDTFKGEFAHAKKGGFPFSLWVLIQYSKQPNGNILISTVGMRDFDHMEIETESSLPLDRTFDLVRQFGSYILSTSPAIKDGDTISLEQQQQHKIKVRHTRSFRPDVNEPVYWLELTEQPTVRKPQGIFSKLFGSSSKH